MRKQNLFILSGLILIFIQSSAQSITQTVRGRVTDNISHAPLLFVSVGIFADSVFVKGVSTDTNGYFRITAVPLGRYIIKASYIGYSPAALTDLIVNSGKETVVNIELEESANTLKEVEIKGINKNQTINEMAIVSARMFSVDETNRYAGSRSDPGRMASNFAGVQGGDDSRNDIIVRGNSPSGVLWRINGVDVPNPNHFAIPGTTGGGVSIINSKVLDNSDFLTGAFPAEYGNTTAGVFDLRFRNGNNEKYENTAQLGFLGTELTSEGPISKQNKSSYLVAFRYSTLKLFESFKIKIGTDAIPNYQDLSFKLNFPSAKGGNLSVFGMGGISKIDILVSNQTQPQQDLYADANKDQYFRSSMGLIGVTKTSVINSTAYAKFTLSYQKGNANEYDNTVWRDNEYLVDSITPSMGYKFLTGRLTGNFTLNKKYSSALNLQTGVIVDRLDYNLVDSTYNLNSYSFVNRLDYIGNTWLVQPYAQLKYKFSDRFVVTGGLHVQYYADNSSKAIEPRAGIRWQFKANQSFSAGFGMHSQQQPYYIYYHHVPDSNNQYVQQNRNLDFTRSIHYVLGYDRTLSPNSHLKLETYYMHLYDIPVTPYPSSYAIINEGGTFDRFFPDKLVNGGTGRNYGVELTFEKFFSHQWFMMFTSSLYQSKYTGSDGIERNTSFNGIYALNLLGEKEFTLSRKNHTSLSTGFKLTREGGQRFTPVDTAKTIAAGDIVVVDSLRNSEQFKDYFRLDLKIGLKINSKKLTHELAFDLVNVLNTKNVLTLIYFYDPRHPQANPIQQEYELGFLPLFYYKVDF